MKIIDVLPRSVEWHQWRQGGLSASDAAVIMNQSPYKTPWQLWAEKTGLLPPVDLSANPHVARGIVCEPIARGFYEAMTGQIVLPLCAESSSIPIIRASFDGINDHGEPVEFKCPSESVFLDLKLNGTSSETYQVYWYQVQQQLLVADAEKGHLVFFYDGELQTYEIKRDDVHLQQFVQQATDFWDRIILNNPPEKCCERDSYIPDEGIKSFWIRYVNDYEQRFSKMKSLESEISVLKVQMKHTENQLLSMMGQFAQAKFAGIKIARYQSEGSVDYKRLITEHFCTELDETLLAKYRKASQQRTRFTVYAEEIPRLANDAVLPAIPTETQGSFYF